MKNSPSSPKHKTKKTSSLKDHLKDAARSALLDAAGLVFADEGTDAAKMTAIALRAGTSVGTLYNHFEDKDALVRALFTDRRLRFEKALEAMAEGSAAAKFHESLQAFLSTCFVHFAAHRPYLRMALRDTPKALAMSRRGGAQTLGLLLQCAERVIDKGRQEGVVVEAHLPLLPRLLVGLVRTMLLTLADDDTIEPAVLVSAVSDLFLHGAQTHTKASLPSR